MTIDDIQEQQGWTDETMLRLMKDFIWNNRLGEKLEKELKAIADEENAESQEPAQ